MRAWRKPGGPHLIIAEVVFDVPLDRAFRYAVPSGMAVAPGQRVRAPLATATRVGLVVATREDSGERLKPLAAVVESSPVLSPAQLALARWIASESCTSLGSTCAALVPPAGGPSAGHPPPEWPGGLAPLPVLFTGRARESRLREHLARHAGGVLVVTPDIAAAAEWTARLAPLGPVRLDSGVGDADRRAAWTSLAAGCARVGVGTRSALLAVVPGPVALALIDEHEAGHKPPGPPRLHSRDVLQRRAAVEGSQLYFTSATPSVEAWWLAGTGAVRLEHAAASGWPGVSVVDTRGGPRAHPLTPAVTRAAHEALRRGQRVCLVVSRLLSVLGCDECGAVRRCPDCGIALAFSKVEATVSCRLCSRREPAPDTCDGCGGRRLSPFGWSAERVEHALRRRFPRARIARYDPEATRGPRLARQLEASQQADIVVGTRGALRLFEPDSLGMVGFVAIDQLLRAPDFRAGERALELAWAGAERVRADGQVVIQSSTPDHHALRALAKQELAEFYVSEVRFREELGYPPFRRLCRLRVRATSESAARELALSLTSRLAGAGLSTYPPRPEARALTWTTVVKGGPELAGLVRAALAQMAPASGRRAARVIEVEMDPVD